MAVSDDHTVIVKNKDICMYMNICVYIYTVYIHIYTHIICSPKNIYYNFCMYIYMCMKIF